MVKFLSIGFMVLYRLSNNVFIGTDSLNAVVTQLNYLCVISSVLGGVGGLARPRPEPWTPAWPQRPRIGLVEYQADNVFTEEGETFQRELQQALVADNRHELLWQALAAELPAQGARAAAENNGNYLMHDPARLFPSPTSF